MGQDQESNKQTTNLKEKMRDTWGLELKAWHNKANITKMRLEKSFSMFELKE